jgi:S-adenosylmethionine:diacylglycerol 3-amino-3-carboxypropyl transferase
MPLNAKAKRKDIHYIMKKVNDFFSKRLPPVFSKFVLRTLTAGCQCIINCYIGRFYGAAQTCNF